MPSINLPTIDFTINSGSNKQELQQILDTLTKYRKELNFLLMNLDADNMPTIAGYIEDAFGNISLIQQTIDEITIMVGNAEGDIASLQVRADSISALVGNNAADIASLVIRAGSIETAVSNNAGDISTLTQTAQGIQTQISDSAGAIATLTQTAQGIQTQVTNNAGQISSVVQTVNGIQSTVASHTTELGSVYSTITQLSTSISSKVSYSDYTGTEIVSLIEQTPNSIKLSANKVDLTGITTIYGTSPNSTFATFNSYSDFYIQDGGNKIFQVTNDIDGGTVGAFNKDYFKMGYYGLFAYGKWNFNNATVTGLNATYS